MTPPPTLQELIDTVRRDAGTDDPIGQLAVASATASDLEQTTDALLGHFVDRCRRAGRSWSEISAALGVTKQAVHKRFAGPLAERLTAATGRPTFDRFTQRARDVLTAAADAATASGHVEIGTGHLLLALYAGPAGIAAKALEAMQVSREHVEHVLREAWARPDTARDEPATPVDADAARSDGEDSAADVRELPEPVSAYGRMSTGARTALLNAVSAALELGHNYIGTEHILLGLYRDPESLAARVLVEAGADRRQAEVRVAELLRGYSKY